MTQYELPEYIRNRQRERVAETSVAGMGGGLPPHISIQGNQFTLIDASGEEPKGKDGKPIPSETVLQAAIVAISKVMCKRYYGPNKYDPNDTQPPVCWSSNGIGPSSLAQTPQAVRCDQCEWNKRGTALSFKGKPIKACRDEKYLALYLPKHPGMLFQLVLTPGSFDNWQTFEKPFEGQQVDVSDVLTEISFQPKTNGVLVFQATDYLPPDVVAICDRALAEKKQVDILIGATDRPFQGALSAPELTMASIDPGFMKPVTAEQIGLTGPAVATAMPGLEQSQKRHRRTKAEMEAARTKNQPAGDGMKDDTVAVQAAQTAPFRPNSGGAPFGVAPSAPAPNPEVQGMLNSIFKTGG